MDIEIDEILQIMKTSSDEKTSKELLVEKTRKMNELSIKVYENEFKNDPSNYTGGYIRDVSILDEIV